MAWVSPGMIQTMGTLEWNLDQARHKARRKGADVYVVRRGGDRWCTRLTAKSLRVGETVWRVRPDGSREPFVVSAFAGVIG